MMFILYLVGLVAVASAADRDFPSVLRGDAVPSGRSAMLEAASFRTRAQVAVDTEIAGARLMRTLSPPSRSSSSGFGTAVAASSQGKVLVGAPWSDNDKGKVFLYDAEGDGEELVVDNLEDSSEFGYAVAFWNDTAVIGAPYAAKDRGAVYLEKPKGLKKIIDEKGAPGDRFGFSLAASGGNIAVGAPYDDDKGDNSGSVYLYPSGIKLTAEDGAAHDCFGGSVALSNAALVVGAPFSVSWRGAAYVFKPDRTGEYVQTNKLTANDGESFDWFGDAVAITETKIYVGAHYHDSDSGAVYQYGLIREDYLYQGKYTGQGQVCFHFGWSLAATNEVLAIGAPGKYSSGSGTVYIHKADSEAITINPDTADGVTGFGYAVSISGDRLVVGTETGNKAYVYDISAIAFLDNEEA